MYYKLCVIIEALRRVHLETGNEAIKGIIEILLQIMDELKGGEAAK